MPGRAVIVSQEVGFELALKGRKHLYREARGNLGKRRKHLCVQVAPTLGTFLALTLPANSDSVLPVTPDQYPSEPLVELYPSLLTFPLTCLCSEGRGCVLCLAHSMCTIDSHRMTEEGMLKFLIQMLGETRPYLSGMRDHIGPSRNLCTLGFPKVTWSELKA